MGHMSQTLQSKRCYEANNCYGTAPWQATLILHHSISQQDETHCPLMHLKRVSALILLKAACCTSSSRNEHRNDISETLWHSLHRSTTANQLQQFSSNVYKRSSSLLAGGYTPYPISYLCVTLFISQQNKRNYQKILKQEGKSIIPRYTEEK